MNPYLREMESKESSKIQGVRRGGLLGAWAGNPCWEGLLAEGGFENGVVKGVGPCGAEGGTPVPGPLWPKAPTSHALRVATGV